MFQSDNRYTGSQGTHQRYFMPHEEASTTLVDCGLELGQLLLKGLPLVLGLLGSNLPLAACTQAKLMCQALFF